MSSFGSSLINKSGRRVAPKAVARRKAPLSGSRIPATDPIGAPSDVVASTEPVATGDEVLGAQIQVQDEVTTAPAVRSRQDETSASLSHTIDESRGSASIQSNGNDGIDTTETSHRQKRLRLHEPSQSAQDETTAAAPEMRPPTAPATRSRSTVQTSNALSLPTPPATQSPRSTRRRRQASVEDPIDVPSDESETAQSLFVQNDEEVQPANDRNWVVTTQDQIRKKTDATKRRQALRKQNSDTDPSLRASASASRETSQTAAGRSARLANLDKRRMKRQALRGIMNGGQTHREDIVISSTSGEIANDDASVHTTIERADESSATPSEAGTSRVDRPRKSRKRANTPEEMENVTIVDSLVTMAELSTRERKYGKKSDRERKMRLIDWDVVRTRRREEEVRMALERGRYRNVAPSNPEDDEDDGDLNNEENLDAALSRVAARNRARRRGTGIRIRVVNGEHFIDEQSQRVDRHALANEDLDALEEVEEEELTQRFNSQTYVNMKRRDPAERLTNNDRWTCEATDKFYECLARFGTDFMIISKMFPGRTRRQIKAKFVREERGEPGRVHEALYGVLNVGDDEEDQRLRWDLDVFRENAGIELSQLLDPKEVARDLESVRVERELAIAEQRKETEEMKRQRRLAGEVSSEDEEEQQQEKSTDQAKKDVLKTNLADHELEEVEEF